MRLPDDIEQFLIVGQRERALRELMKRRAIGFIDARSMIRRWFHEWQEEIDQ